MDFSCWIFSISCLWRLINASKESEDYWKVFPGGLDWFWNLCIGPLQFPGDVGSQKFRPKIMFGHKRFVWTQDFFGTPNFFRTNIFLIFFRLFFSGSNFSFKIYIAPKGFSSKFLYPSPPQKKKKLFFGFNLFLFPKSISTSSQMRHLKFSLFYVHMCILIW